MTKLPANVIAFSSGETGLYDMFADYWNQYRSENGTKKYQFTTVDAQGKSISFAEKEVALNAAIKREISKRAGVDFSSMPLEQAITHPLVAWAANNIVSQLIEAIMPETIIDSIGAYAEVRTIGYGETALFNINSRDLFPVSRSGRMGMRQAEVQKGFQGQVALNPEQRTMTVGVSLWRLLNSQESLAVFASKAMRSLETEMTKDVYDAMAVAMAALSTTATTGLRVVGYTQADLVTLAQKVSAFSGGAKPIVLGTKNAISQILPDDANYRYQLTDSYVTLGYLRTIAGIDILELPQVANWKSPFSTYLNNDRLWIVAPGQDRIVKLVLGGATMSNTTGVFDAATLTQDTTFYKLWKASVVTSAVGAQITLA
jgi:hypothetical protein